jgi:hypothetical protein
MEIRILVLVGLLFAYGLLNLAVFVSAYLSLSRLTTKVTGAANEIKKGSQIRQWIDSAHDASQQAAAGTETAKRRVAEFDPKLRRFQEKCHEGLAKVDERLDLVANGINGSTQKVTEVIAAPAYSAIAFAAGISRVLEKEE